MLVFASVEKLKHHKIRFCILKNNVGHDYVKDVYFLNKYFRFHVKTTCYHRTIIFQIDMVFTG